MNNELSKIIQERIEVNNITPLPRWRFILLSCVFWITAGLSVVIGSFAVGAILFLFFDYSHHNLLTISEGATGLLLMIPYLWIIIFLLFIAIAHLSIQHTKKGYHYKIHSVIVISVLLSLIFGSILNFIGISKTTHESLKEIRIYNYATYDSRDAYNRPVIGRLAGVVTSVQNKDNFSIMDFRGHSWNVHLGTSTYHYIPKINSTVQMFGILEGSTSIFQAKSIREWGD